jgi:hypothetical protein
MLRFEGISRCPIALLALCYAGAIGMISEAIRSAHIIFIEIQV